MVERIDAYNKALRDAIVADQMKLFMLHVAIYLVVNIIWVLLNYMNYIEIEPSWAMWYSPVGWGLLIVVQYLFYVKGAEETCKLREERVEASIR